VASPEVDRLWRLGELRAATELSAQLLAATAHPFRDAALDDDLAAAARWHDHGCRCWQLTRQDEADVALGRAHAIRHERLGRAHPDTLASLERLAGLAAYRAEDELAHARWLEVIAASPRDGLGAAIARRNYSTLYRSHGDLREARRLIEQASAHFTRHVADDDLEYLALRKANAMLAYQEQQYVVALRLVDAAIEHAPLAPEHPFVAAARLVAARAHRALGDRVASGELAAEVVTAFERGYGAHPLLAIALSFAARLAREAGELERACALAGRALAMYRLYYPLPNPSTLAFARQLREILVAMGRPDDAYALDAEIKLATRIANPAW